MNTSWWRNVTHFTAKEFACPETGEALVSCDLVVMLDKARTFAATPFTITSGYRSPAHNRKVGGVPGSAHTKGLAADIAAPNNKARHDIVRGLIEAGCVRIGIGKGFVHADVDLDKPWPRLWTY